MRISRERTATPSGATRRNGPSSVWCEARMSSGEILLITSRLGRNGSPASRRPDLRCVSVDAATRRSPAPSASRVSVVAGRSRDDPGCGAASDRIRGGLPCSGTHDGGATVRKTVHHLRRANSRSTVSMDLPSELVRLADRIWSSSSDSGTGACPGRSAGEGSLARACTASAGRRRRRQSPASPGTPERSGDASRRPLIPTRRSPRTRRARSSGGPPWDRLPPGSTGFPFGTAPQWGGGDGNVAHRFSYCSRL